MSDTVTQTTEAPQTTAQPTPETQAAPQTTQQVQQAFEDQLRQELGLGANVSNKVLLEGAARAMSSYQEGIEAIQRLKDLQTQPEVKPEPAADSWGPVEWDDKWLSQVERTPEGYRAKAGVDPSVVQKFYAAERRRQEILDRLSKNPTGSMQELAGKLGLVTKEQLQEMLTQTVAQQRELQEREAYVRDNWDWLVQKDAGGQQQYDGQGRPMQSEKGRAFFNLTQALTPESMKDWNARAKIAQMVIQGMFPQDGQMQANAAPRKSQEQERAEALVNASRGRAPAQAPVTLADQSQQGRSSKDRLAESLGITDGDSGYEVFARLLGGR